MAKKSAKYKRGFREGYNNPSQYSDEKLLQSTNEFAEGVIAGKIKRVKNRIKGINEFIWNEDDLMRELE